jgi:hypothetical protein
LIINSQGVAKQLSELNPSKACGPDEIPARTLKNFLHQFRTGFVSFSNNPMILVHFHLTGQRPLFLLFLKDLKSNPANYRPISLTCLCCKVMEHIILSHVSMHLAYDDILINEQHGFRKLFSCETQLITAINDWAKSINQKKQTDVILLDFSKAFDSVPHLRLMSKLDHYGIRGLSANWIKAFLSNRSQVVSVNGSHSHPQPVISGVPQGTILAPVLFLLYINDISEIIKSQIRLFADDGIIYREINDDQDHVTLQEDLDNLNNWANKCRQLNFNFSKCYHLGITNKRVPETYSHVMNNQIISRVSSTKYLGITINHNLNWNKHCDIICSKANSTLGLLRRILGECSAAVTSRAYTSLVHPQLEYVSTDWNPYTKRNINKIEMVQRRAARFVFNDYSRASHVSAIIDHLGWDNLQQRRLLHQATMFYKIHQGLVGINLLDDVCPLTRASRLPNYNICPYRQIQSCVNVYKFSLCPRTIVTWNHIPFTGKLRKAFLF